MKKNLAGSIILGLAALCSTVSADDGVAIYPVPLDWKKIPSEDPTVAVQMIASVPKADVVHIRHTTGEVSVYIILENEVACASTVSPAQGSFLKCGQINVHYVYTKLPHQPGKLHAVILSDEQPTESPKVPTVEPKSKLRASK